MGLTWVGFMLCELVDMGQVGFRQGELVSRWTVRV
jgi:hypothetical protein